MKKNNWLRLFLFYYLPILLWMGLIFCLSSIEGNGYKGVPDFWFYAKRKGAHFLEFFVLTILIARPILKSLKRKKDFLGKVFITGQLSLLYAASDEFHQTFVHGREGKILDVGIDLIGIVLAASLMYVFYYKNKTLKRFLS